jgi:peptidyl-prolyl cis-trans isomerase B (cyclophilin B)
VAGATVREAVVRGAATFAAAALVVLLAACSAQGDASSGMSGLFQEGSTDAPASAQSGPPRQPGQAAQPAAQPAGQAVPTAAAKERPAGGDAAPVSGGEAQAAPSNVIRPRPTEPLTAEQVAALSGQVAELRTSQGTLVLEFLPQKAPGTVQNFVDLARRGFYDGTIVHRVIPGMIVQMGDPTGTGDGGPGYFIQAEFNDEPHVRGTVSMARLRHPDSAGSQFFICLAPLPHLDGGYTAFGRVLSGDDVLERIEKLGRATPQGTPIETITLEKVLIRPRSPAERLTASRHP